MEIFSLKEQSAHQAVVRAIYMLNMLFPSSILFTFKVIFTVASILHLPPLVLWIYELVIKLNLNLEYFRVNRVIFIALYFDLNYFKAM